MVRRDDEYDVSASGVGERAQHVVEERPSSAAQGHHSLLAGSRGELLNRIELSPLVPFLHSPPQPAGQYDAQELAALHHHKRTIARIVTAALTASTTAAMAAAATWPISR